jgi:hypothetical protein
VIWLGMVCVLNLWLSVDVLIGVQNVSTVVFGPMSVIILAVESSSSNVLP